MRREQNASLYHTFVAVLIDTVAATEYALRQLPHAVPEPRLDKFAFGLV